MIVNNVNYFLILLNSDKISNTLIFILIEQLNKCLTLHF